MLFISKIHTAASIAINRKAKEEVNRKIRIDGTTVLV